MAASPSRPDQAGDDQHRAVGQDDDKAGDQPDLQDVAEGTPAEPVDRPAQPERRLGAGEFRQHPERGEGEGDHRGDGGTPDAQGRQAEPSQGQRAGERDLYSRRHDQCQAGRLHVAGAAQDGRHRIGDPVGDTAREQDGGEGLGAVEGRAAAAQRAIDLPAEAYEEDAEQHRHADRNGQRMRCRCLGGRLVAGAQGAGHRGGDAAAHGAGRHHAERHLRREHQRQRGEVDDAQLADEIAVGDADEALHGHVQDVRRRKGEDGGHDRPGQHHLPALHGSHCGRCSTRRAACSRTYLMG